MKNLVIVSIFISSLFFTAAAIEPTKNNHWILLSPVSDKINPPKNATKPYLTESSIQTMKSSHCIKNAGFIYLKLETLSNTLQSEKQRTVVASISKNLLDGLSKKQISVQGDDIRFALSSGVRLLGLEKKKFPLSAYQHIPLVLSSNMPAAAAERTKSIKLVDTGDLDLSWPKELSQVAFISILPEPQKDGSLTYAPPRVLIHMKDDSIECKEKVTHLLSKLNHNSVGQRFIMADVTLSSNAASP